MAQLSTTQKKRGGAIFAVFAIVASIVIGFAAPAFAHHSEIEAGADCDGLVSWTAEAWIDSTPTQQERTNQNVRVWYRVGNVAVPSGNPVAPAAGDVEVATGAFNIGNGYSFGGTFPMPADQTTITVFVQEQGKWGTATPPTGAGVAQARRAVVTLPTDCPTPDITIEVECEKIIIRSTKDLSNIIWQSGDDPSQRVEGLTGTYYELPNDPANPITAVWVKSGNNKVEPGDPLPNPPFGNNQGIGAYFAVAAPTGCEGDPTATAEVECTDEGGTITVTLDNEGGSLPATFEVTNPADPTDVRTVVVAVDETDEVSFTAVPDGTYEVPVSVTYPGGEPIDKTITGVVVACDGVPVVQGSAECSTTGGVVTLTLSNDAPAGGKSVEFVVSGPGTPDGPTTVSVAAGDSTTLVFSGVADGTATYEITRRGVARRDLRDRLRRCAGGVGVVGVLGDGWCRDPGAVEHRPGRLQGRGVRGVGSGYARRSDDGERGRR
ncbi:MAG: hypothetical protein MUE36_13695 [Acidimicrobiales bacterium]|nr:hypothetical protein [Acidimicrobiales bacterium]